MVLSVVTMLMLALMMVVGFNVAHTVHERMRIQQAADAQAFTVAILQARALNVNAVLNRTIAALTVAQMSLHAWNTVASHEIDMLNAGSVLFIFVMFTELGMCNPKKPTHCIHAAQAGGISGQYSSTASEYENKLRNSEQQFKQAVQQLYQAKKDIFDQQKQLVSEVEKQINNGDILQDMLRRTAPQASYVDLHGINVSNFNCTIDGPEDQCNGSEPLVFPRGSQTADIRSKTMQQAANAARSEANMADGKAGALHDHSDFRGASVTSVSNPPKMMDIQGEGNYEATYMPGAFESRVGSSSFSQSANAGETAENVGSGTGFGFAQVSGWKHGGTHMWMLGSSVYSSQSGGEHTGAVGDSHSEFEGLGNDGAPAQFITYRGHTSPSDSNDWGQPNAYGGVTQDLRLLQNGGRGAFEVAKNGSGQINIKIGQEQHRVTLVPTTNGIAVGKAKAYFHQLGNWSVPPNGFDPFWRAKLHPFRDRDELSQVLNLAGDQSANVQGPVEGKE